ncbi:MAG: hypothetical protein E7660_06705 [Ruminococcaceae bacterium]|nr:hypothetical protein [Oscillospiraceae bacterium]
MPNLFKNDVAVSKKQARILSSLPRELSEDEISVLGKLIGEQVVFENELKTVPKSLSEAVFCSRCLANDFIIPGLEFDESGLCPMCQTANDVKELKSVVPLVDEIPRSKKSRFDIALFYTGGKDSAYLLYYLSEVKGLRVLALTWEIPYISDSAAKSIENAKKIFGNVEFISRSVSQNVLRRFYKKLYSLNGNTCACPSLAYLLFYPELVANRVPYFAAGNEPVQMLGLYYNHMAPKIAYSFANSRFLTFVMNVVRVLTLHPPLKQGQFQTLMTMKQLAYGDNIVLKHSGYKNELVSGIVEAIRAVPELLPPFTKSIRRSSSTGNVPAFVHVDLDKICGGKYDWNAVKSILVNECGWVPPADENKALHTSCKIEKCKDHTQFLRFYHCKSKMIPFSALEFSLASRNCGRTKEESLYEMEHLLGFSVEEIPECAIMRQFLGDEI